MKRIWNTIQRPLALTTAAFLTLGLLTPALAAEPIAPSCDETYYATLDYYGALLDSSVVKTFHTHGNAILTDYGTYDQVTNLTDSRPASVTDGKVAFDLTGDVPDKFYFEGKTAQPYEDFPWSLSLTYTLNGVPTPAEQLAGEKGVVEITLHAAPNPAASEYSRNNLVLTAVSMFNGDDILSLEAPGAQVQLIGNLYCVLYAVLPGEEQDFTIRVGSEDFSYSGMTFLAVPATLEQLDQVASLKDAKDQINDSYHALNDSLDVILNTLEGMSGSLNATANGLDLLNQARGIVSGGKNQVYDSLDAALEAAGPLTESMQPMSGHLDTAQQALTETNTLLNAMSDNVTGLKPEVENTRTILTSLQSDLLELQALADDLTDANTLERARRISGSLASDLEDLQESMETLSLKLNGLTGISSVPGITVNGMTVDEIQAYVVQANQLRGAYEAAGVQALGLSFEDFISLYLIYNASAELQTAFPDFTAFVTAQLTGPVIDLTDPAYTQAVSSAGTLASLWAYAQTSEYEEAINQAGTVNGVIGGVNDKLSEVNRLISSLSRPTADLLLDLEEVTDDLESLSRLTKDSLQTIEEHSGTLSSLLDTLNGAAGLATRLTGNLDTALEQVEALTGILNTYDPDTQQALEDAKTFTGAASDSISALVDAAQAAEELLKNSGASLDSGTYAALSGLADALRQSTAGLDQTGVIRDARDTIDALITDQWNSHVGEDNNLLLMDAGAAPQSLTDRRNEGTSSIQYVMRSQEIKEQEPPQEETTEAEPAKKTTFWGRIKAMFVDIWNAITSIF